MYKLNMVSIDPDNPAIIKDFDKCVECGHCLSTCQEDISVARLYDLEKNDFEPICVHCGQCAAVCPENSITVKKEYQQVRAAVQDKDKIVIVSTSPAVRVAIAEEFGKRPGEYAEGKMVASLRKLGVDYVLDTTFGADLTIMEEASELIERIKTGGVFPQFTSCCPAWVKFVETFHPDLIPNISSAKSPIGMQGPTIKTYFAEKMNIDPTKIVNVALTPCTAKKFEIRRPEMNAAAKELNIEGMRDMDYVITTSELAEWLRMEKVDFNELEESAYDDLLGRGTGAGIIFGNTGGVMEAAVREAYAMLTGERLPQELLEYKPVRGLKGIKSAVLKINDLEVKIAVASGLANAEELIKTGVGGYHFIEVMTCPGGCIGGGGQPKPEVLPLQDSIRQKRIAGLYGQDDKMEKRISSDNPDIAQIYKEFYEKPLSKKAERILHTNYISRASDLK